MDENQLYQKYLRLAQKWVEGTISEEELKEYTDWLKQIDADASLDIPQEIAPNKEAHRQKIYNQLRERIQNETQSPFKPAYRRVLQWAAVFTGIILFGYAIYFLRAVPKANLTTEISVSAPTDIMPGTNGAVLTLANGKVILLDTAANGTLDNNVMKNQEAIVFEATPAGDAVQYNTLSTPRARQQQLVLPDGSQVWLNAESSIRFPTAFSGSKREITITGEVYFEVAPNKNRPFVVNVRDASVVVLGTHFNVMAYPNEAFLETTLLEGAVSFRNKTEQMTLRPGQQSRLSANQQLQLIPNPDVEVVMAWKNGFQSFKKTDIGAILRQVKRWYDVDVEYEGEIPEQITFTGDIPREVSLSQLLKALESKQLRFTLDASHKKLHVQFTP